MEHESNKYKFCKEDPREKSVSEVGGNESDVSPTPEPGNRFRFRLRLRCVRACERAKLRARDDSSVAGAGRANLWGSGPSVRSGPSTQRL